MYSRLEVHCFSRVKETIKLLGSSLQCFPLCGLLVCFGNVGSSPLTALNSTLSSVILIVLGIVNLKFQGQFVPICLRPVLGIVAADVKATVWSSCS